MSTSGILSKIGYKTGKSYSYNEAQNLMFDAIDAGCRGGNSMQVANAVGVINNHMQQAGNRFAAAVGAAGVVAGLLAGYSLGKR